MMNQQPHDPDHQPLVNPFGLLANRYRILGYRLDNPNRMLAICRLGDKEFCVQATAIDSRQPNELLILLNKLRVVCLNQNPPRHHNLAQFLGHNLIPHGHFIYIFSCVPLREFDRWGVLHPRFKYLSMLGQGASGLVAMFADTQSNLKGVAVKKVVIPVGEGQEIRKQLFQTLFEIRLMRLLKHRNLIHIRWGNIMADQTECQVFMVTPLMDMNLQEFIGGPETRGRFSLKSFSKNKKGIQQICFQMFLAVKALHEQGIFHRDIKPDNFLLRINNLRVILADFGWARACNPTRNLTRPAAVRSYRAPEVDLFSLEKNYDGKVDIWGIGCIMYELMTGQKLFPSQVFDPRTPDLHIKKIVEVGEVEEDDLNLVNDPLDRQRIRDCMRNLNDNSLRSTIQNSFGLLHSRAVDLLLRCLKFNPAKRISAIEALEHPFFRQMVNIRPSLTVRQPELLNLQFDPRTPFKELIHLLGSEIEMVQRRPVVAQQPREPIGLGTISGGSDTC